MREVPEKYLIEVDLNKEQRLEQAGEAAEIKQHPKIAIVEDESEFVDGLKWLIEHSNVQGAQVDWINPADYPETKNIPLRLLNKLSGYDIVFLDDSLHGGKESYYKGRDIAKQLPSHIKILSTTGNSAEIKYGDVDLFGAKSILDIVKRLEERRGGKLVEEEVMQLPQVSYHLKKLNSFFDDYQKEKVPHER